MTHFHQAKDDTSSADGSGPVVHFHTLYGIPAYGLAWTDDHHDTPAEAWGAMFGVLTDNWEQEREAIKAHPAKFGHIREAYSRAMILSLTIEAPGRVHIPSLDLCDNGLTYGVVACAGASC